MQSCTSYRSENKEITSLLHVISLSIITSQFSRPGCVHSHLARHLVADGHYEVISELHQTQNLTAADVQSELRHQKPRHESTRPSNSDSLTTTERDQLHETWKRARASRKRVCATLRQEGLTAVHLETVDHTLTWENRVNNSIHIEDKKFQSLKYILKYVNKWSHTFPDTISSPESGSNRGIRVLRIKNRQIMIRLLMLQDSYSHKANILLTFLIHSCFFKKFIFLYIYIYI